MKRGIVIVVLFASILFISIVFAIPEGTLTNGGDANGDGRVDLTDSVNLLNNLFLGGSAPVCRRAVDTNADGRIDLTDAIRILNFLFQGGQAPVFQDVAPGSCDIVGDMSGQTLINPETGEEEEIGDHVRIEIPRDHFLSTDSGSFYCGSYSRLLQFKQEAEQRSTHITLFDTSCEIPIYYVIVDSASEFRFIYLGCSSDGKTDIIEYNHDLFCASGKDKIRAIASSQIVMFGGVSHIYTGSGDDYIESYNRPISDNQQGITSKLYGGRGKDTIYGNEAENMIFGGIGDDTLYGDDGNDIIFGGEDDDIIYGNSDSTEIFPEYNIIFGGSGGDTIYGQGLENFIWGDGGYRVRPNRQGATGFQLAEEDIGDPGDDHIFSKKGSPPYSPRTSIFFGGGGDDIIVGSDGPDFIFGNNGEDILKGFAGDDFILGDTPDTDADIEGNTNEVTHELEFVFSTQDSGGTRIRIPPDWIDTSIAFPLFNPFEEDLQKIFNSDPYKKITMEHKIIEAEEGGNDVIEGGPNVDVIFGEKGDDTINGGLGDDWLFGGSGDDKVYPESGEDIAYGGNGDDEVGDQIEGEGDATELVSANYGDDPVVCGGKGKDKVYDGAEIESVDYLMAGPRKVEEPDKAEDIFGHEAHTQTFYINLYREVADQSNCGATDCYYTPNRWFELSDFPLPLDRSFQNVQPFYVKLPDCFFPIEIAGIPPSSSDDDLPPV